MNIFSYYIKRQKINILVRRLRASRQLGLHIVNLRTCYTRESSIFRMLCREIGIARNFSELYTEIESKKAPAFICNIHGFLRNLDQLSLTERDTEMLLLMTEDKTGFFEKRMARLMLDVTFELTGHERTSREMYGRYALDKVQRGFYPEK